MKVFMQNKGQVQFLILIALIVIFIGLLFGRAFITFTPQHIFAVTAGLLLVIITFINTDLSIIILIFSMLLSPELEVAQVPERAVVIRIDDILLIMTFFAWLAKMTINKELGFLKRTPINTPIISYILIYFLSTGLGIITGGISPKTSFFYILKYIEYFLLYFMVTNNIWGEKQVRVFIIAILITCTIICIYANMTLKQFGRVTMPFEGRGGGEPNTLGGYLVLLFAIAAGFFLYSPLLVWRFCSGAIACLVFFTLLNTLSRGSFVAFIPMYLTLIIFTRKGKKLLIVILILAILLLPIILPDKVIHRIKETFSPVGAYKVYGGRLILDESTAARIESIKTTFMEVKATPLLGRGAARLSVVDSHISRVLLEIGFIGFFIFIWLMVAIFRNSLRIFRIIEGDWARGLILGFLAGFVGLLFHSLSASTFIIVRIMEPFWFLTATVAMLPEIKMGLGEKATGGSEIVE